jgi:hypothetical protein
MNQRERAPAHVEVETLLLAASKERRLSAEEREHLTRCDDCRELLITFVRQNLVRFKKAS